MRDSAVLARSRLRRAAAGFGNMPPAAASFGQIAADCGRMKRDKATLIAEADFGK